MTIGEFAEIADRSIPRRSSVSSASGLSGVNAPRIGYFSGNPERARRRWHSTPLGCHTSRAADPSFADEKVDGTRGMTPTYEIQNDADEAYLHQTLTMVKRHRRRSARAFLSLSTAIAAATAVARYVRLFLYRLHPNLHTDATLVIAMLSTSFTLSLTHLYTCISSYARAAEQVAEKWEPVLIHIITR